MRQQIKLFRAHRKKPFPLFPAIPLDEIRVVFFQGDFLAKNVRLPTLDVGDILVIHDTGAYTLSLYSKVNSILCGPVYGFEKSSWQPPAAEGTRGIHRHRPKLEQDGPSALEKNEVGQKEEEDNRYRFLCYKRQETFEELLAFWGEEIEEGQCNR